MHYQNEALLNTSPSIRMGLAKRFKDCDNPIRWVQNERSIDRRTDGRTDKLVEKANYYDDSNSNSDRQTKLRSGLLDHGRILFKEYLICILFTQFNLA